MQYFMDLAERLDARHVPLAHIRRSIDELCDHVEDSASSGGWRTSDAEVSQLLGDVDHLACSIALSFQATRFHARHPLIACVVIPLALCLLIPISGALLLLAPTMALQEFDGLLTPSPLRAGIMGSLGYVALVGLPLLLIMPYAAFAFLGFTKSKAAGLSRRWRIMSLAIPLIMCYLTTAELVLSDLTNQSSLSFGLGFASDPLKNTATSTCAALIVFSFVRFGQSKAAALLEDLQRQRLANSVAEPTA